jgi:hypothetical protein
MARRHTARPSTVGEVKAIVSARPKAIVAAGTYTPTVAQTPATRPVGQERAGPQAASGGLNVGFLNALGMARDIFFGKPSTKK